MTPARIKTITIALAILGILAWVFFKWVKPKMDAKKELNRKKVVAVVSSAQPAPMAAVSTPNPTAPSGVSLKRIGIGGVEL